MFDWFFRPADVLTTSDSETYNTYTTIPIDHKSTFSLDKVVVKTTTEGDIKIEIHDVVTLTVPKDLRYAFLEKLQKAVDMADIVDPSHKLTKG